LAIFVIKTETPRTGNTW